ncbi:MAG: hypothetical protein ACHQ2F_11300, partial [Desulfobaccales bacterium]
SARRAPTTRLWRLAKAAATRYLSPENSGTVAAREVVAGYVAALAAGGGPGPAGALAAFRQTRRTAQNLGAFCCQADSRGWLAALEDWGWQALGAGSEVPIPALSAALEAPGGGLEQAVAHTALMGILPKLPRASSQGEEPARLVRSFLVEAFGLRLALDLGESLEAAAPGISSLRQGLTGLAAWIDRAAILPNLPPAPLTPEEWLGLPGWIWVSSLMTELILNLAGSSPKYLCK